MLSDNLPSEVDTYPAGASPSRTGGPRSQSRQWGNGAHACIGEDRASEGRARGGKIVSEGRPACVSHLARRERVYYVREVFRGTVFQGGGV
jgi:hypothetical protein